MISRGAPTVGWTTVAFTTLILVSIGIGVSLEPTTGRLAAVAIAVGASLALGAVYAVAAEGIRYLREKGRTVDDITRDAGTIRHRLGVYIDQRVRDETSPEAARMLADDLEALARDIRRAAAETTDGPDRG